MMIEMVLVIAIAAILILIGLQYYRHCNRLMQLALVNNDMTVLRASLNRFYDVIPCDGNGMLQANLNVDVLSQLDLAQPLVKRSPYVMQYHAMIIESNVLTDQQKPIYMLQISADINPSHAGVIPTLLQQWHATRYIGNTVYWVSLPNNSITEPGSDLWGMTVSRDAFRNLKNDPTINAGAYSHAYCAT